MEQKKAVSFAVTVTLENLVKTVCCLVLSIGVAAADGPPTQDGSSTPPPAILPLNPQTLHTGKLDTGPSCIYTEWSEWSGDCAPAKACAGGIQTRNRQPAGTTDMCVDIVQEKKCHEDCVSIFVTNELRVNGMIDNPASTEEEGAAPRLWNVLEESQFTFGSLSSCSPGCSDIDKLDRDHEIVCIMCPNVHSCQRAKALKVNRIYKLDFVRGRREGLYVTKANGANCLCSFVPEDDLKPGVCPSPSPDMNLTVL
jgi:hypothetical protein